MSVELANGSRISVDLLEIEEDVEAVISCPEDFTLKLRQELMKQAEAVKPQKLLVSITPEMISHRPFEGSDVTVGDWLETNGLGTALVEYNEGLAALDRAVETYGEAIMASYLFQTYVDMIRRCYDPSHPRFPDEGARGIEVCREWLEDFAAFARDVTKAPGATKEIRQSLKELKKRSPELRRRLRPN